MGLPIFGTSNYTSPRWEPEISTRGTWGLIQTCVLTLGLCIYSAFHLNVFDPKSTWWAELLVRAKWLLVALLAPEFIVFNAWAQRRQAIRIAMMLRKRSGQEEGDSWIARLWKYTRGKYKLLDREKDTLPVQIQTHEVQDGRLSKVDNSKITITSIQVRSRLIPCRNL